MGSYCLNSSISGSRAHLLPMTPEGISSRTKAHVLFILLLYIFIFQKQALAMLLRQDSNPWAQGIFPPQAPNQLGLQAHASVPSFRTCPIMLKITHNKPDSNFEKYKRVQTPLNSLFLVADTTFLHIRRLKSQKTRLVGRRYKVSMSQDTQNLAFNISKEF